MCFGGSILFSGWLDRRCWLEPRRAAWERLMNESWLLRCLTYFHLFQLLIAVSSAITWDFVPRCRRGTAHRMGLQFENPMLTIVTEQIHTTRYWLRLVNSMDFFLKVAWCCIDFQCCNLIFWIQYPFDITSSTHLKILLHHPIIKKGYSDRQTFLRSLYQMFYACKY